MKILHLILKKKWFDMILSGEKKEEYREIKPYWTKRFFNKDGSTKDYNIIRFKNGYNPDSPMFDIDFKGIRIGKGKPEWGGDEYNVYIISLGDIIKYNHNRPLKDFQKSIDIIKKEGFNPIAVSQLYFEDTFVFETSEEGLKGYNLLEKDHKLRVVGWWYGKEEFLKTVEEYETENNGFSKVLIHWLNK